MKALIIVVAVVAFMLNGCGSAVQTAFIAADVAIKAHSIAGKLSDGGSNSNISVGKEIDIIFFKDYTVQVSEGRNKTVPIILFIAYKGSREEGNIFFETSNSDDMRMFVEYNNMNTVNHACPINC